MVGLAVFVHGLRPLGPEDFYFYLFSIFLTSLSIADGHKSHSDYQHSDDFLHDFVRLQFFSI